MADAPNTHATFRTRLDRFRRNILADMELCIAAGPTEVLHTIVDALEHSGVVHAAKAYLLEGQTLTCVTAPSAHEHLPLSRTDHPAVRALARTLISDYREDGYVDFSGAVGGPPGPTGVLHAVLTDDSLDTQLLVRHLFQAASDRMRLLQVSANKALPSDSLERPAPRHGLFERVVHEVRNPLAAMLAHLEVLRLDRGDDSVVAEHVDALILQVNRLAAILDAARTFARTSADASGRADVAAGLHAIAALVKYQYRAGGVQFQLDISDDLPSIRGSGGALEQAWLNYFHNAFNAMCAKAAPGGCLRVKARYNHQLRHILVEIADDGIGMDAGTLKSLTSARRPADMPGIGTREAAHIIAEHHGRTDFTSVPGRGTTVRVTLPVADIEADTPFSGAEP